MEEIKDIAVETIQAILPIAVIVVILQLILFEQPWPMVGQFLVGVVMVTLGLGLFLLGVKVGLLPLGEAIGSELPTFGSMPILLFETLVNLISPVQELVLSSM